MSKSVKKPTFNFFLRKNGELVNLKELSDEEQHQVGVWAYQTMIKSLGYTPVENNT